MAKELEAQARPTLKQELVDRLRREAQRRGLGYKKRAGSVVATVCEDWLGKPPDPYSIPPDLIERVKRVIKEGGREDGFKSARTENHFLTLILYDWISLSNRVALFSAFEEGFEGIELPEHAGKGEVTREWIDGALDDRFARLGCRMVDEFESVRELIERISGEE